MSAEFVARVLTRMKKLEMNPRSVSLAAGLNPTFVRDLVRRPNSSPSLDSITRLAFALQTSPEWLAYGSDVSMSQPIDPLGLQKAIDLSADHGKPPSTFVRAAYGGLVEADSYRPADAFEDDCDREPIYVQRDPRFPQAQHCVFDVAGDSMNALEPIPILPGSRLVCISIDQTRVPYRHGSVVVVEQTANGGTLRERSVKQVEMHEDRVAFCPRSRNPKHKPIVVPRDRTADDGVTIAVVAIVLDTQNRIPF